jgi:hypothetical protein
MLQQIKWLIANYYNSTEGKPDAQSPDALVGCVTYDVMPACRLVDDLPGHGTYRQVC